MKTTTNKTNLSLLSCLYSHIMENLSEEEISEFREIFSLVDRDGGGSITGEELGELLDTLGIEATMEEIDAMIREVA